MGIRVMADVSATITTVDVLQTLITTMGTIKSKTAMLESCFTRAGLVDGAPDPSHFSPATYKAGMAYRDGPEVTEDLLKQVSAARQRASPDRVQMFSPRTLCQRPGAPFDLVMKSAKKVCRQLHREYV